MGLREQLADLPERFAAWRMGELRLGRRIVYDVKANWKLVAENFWECYHCTHAHPEFCSVMSYAHAGNSEKWCGREDSNLHGLPR